MSAGGYEYTFYFAWVASGTVPWDLSLARFDEIVFTQIIDHEEGQIPTAVVEVINPRIGLLDEDRDYWCWLSFSYEACEPQPLFLGRLIGIPEEGTLENTILMKFIARAEDYVYQKQQVARSLKVLPNYDVIFFDIATRDDPDAILEGWSALYHVDRISNRVSASDILLGEDGTVTFAPQDVFYDSVKYRLLQTPLTAVNVKMDVQWEQQYRGFFQVGQWAFPTLGGDAFVGDWPKSGGALGGGWSAGVSWAGQRDPSIEQEMMATQKPQVPSISYHWVNTAKKHRTGDTMSITINYTEPWGSTIVLKQVTQLGMIDPNAVDAFGDPDPVNRPAKQSTDWFCYKTFALDFLGRQSVATLGLVYEADRKRSERLEMTIEADVQPTMIDPDIVEETEQIALKSGNLSQPLINMLNWDTVGMGGTVDQGQIIFPDNPNLPGQTSSQIALNSGNTGMEFPDFSNVPGQTTVDGSVTWASLGVTAPPEGTQDWLPFARIPLGTLILPKPVSGVPDINSIRIPGSLNYPPTGTAVAKYQVFSAGFGGPGLLMHEVVVSGLLGGLGGPQAVLHNFINPTGRCMFIAIQAGMTGQFHPTYFNETLGAQTGDGSVIWQSIGPVTLPIGGSPGMTPAHSYFSTDRGRLSVQHGFCRGRAKLRKRARAARIDFETRFEVAAQLSCRMNGNITDARLPGGGVSGKVVAYRLEVSGGEEGEGSIVKGSVTLGCSVGKSTIATFMAAPTPQATLDLNDPSYVGNPGPINGYVKPGYQKYYSTVSGAPPGTPPSEGVPFPAPPTPPGWPTLPPSLPPVTCPPLNSVWSAGPVDPHANEMEYTPPISSPNDDGLTFPLHPFQAMLASQWHGTPSTMDPINLEIYNIQLQQIIHNAVAQANATREVNFSAVGGVASGTITVPVSPFYDIQVAVQIAVLKAKQQGNNLWYELVLKPVKNGPFSNYYTVKTTPMQVLQTIDLSAPSTL